MTKHITQLDATTINKIAAGEVIERPMAVVKELVENSIDSGANAITVEIKEGGISFLRITDNGSGISGEEIPIAFRRHATSKIHSVEDLLTIQSLGFRGEALASIAAVSQVELITKTKDEVMGSRYEIHGGEEKTKEHIGAPDGTTFIIRNLFYNTPARKKFLKSKATEGGYINDIMIRFALSHPDISFKFIIDNRTKLQTSGNGVCKNNIFYVYGNDITKALIEVEAHRESMKLSGFIGKPEISRGNRGFMNYFINGRYVKSSIISKAVEDAYKSFMMQHKYPFVTLFLEMDSELLDVNVHPTKMEVRFQKGEEVYNLFYETIVNALRESTLIPMVPLKEEPSPVKNTPATPVSVTKTLDTKNAEPFETVFRKQYVDKPFVREVPDTKYAQNSLENVVAPNLYKEELKIEKNRLDFRIIGQVFATYWLIEYKDELLIIDQHAAHEKVLYEQIMKDLKSERVMSQNLLVPIIVSLTPMEEEVLKKHQDVFRELGFDIDFFGGSEYALKGVPSQFLSLSSKEFFIDLLDGLMDNRKSDSQLIRSRCATMACKAAVKGNMNISYREAEELINEMLQLENPYNCPHGRPTTIAMSKEEFEKKFKRIV